MLSRKWLTIDRPRFGGHFVTWVAAILSFAGGRRICVCFLEHVGGDTSGLSTTRGTSSKLDIKLYCSCGCIHLHEHESCWLAAVSRSGQTNGRDDRRCCGELLRSKLALSESLLHSV